MAILPNFMGFMGLKTVLGGGGAGAQQYYKIYYKLSLLYKL
jgi:hypothetical protein